MRVSPTIMIVGSATMALMNAWVAGDTIDFMLAKGGDGYALIPLIMLNMWVAYDLIKGIKPLAERYALERVKKERDRGDRDL